MFRLDSDRALVLTTDFFPPIVDDPRWFGRIAAANALSDVYAMGGQALSVLNLVGWPKGLDDELLAEMLAGGLDKVREAGAALAGGHSVVDHEIKYGLAVTGIVHPQRFWRNGSARPGDRLLLTKPLGMGAVATAIKKECASNDVARRAMEQMATLNKAAADCLRGFDVHAATDVTGFGLFGHGREMAEGSGLTLSVRARDLPIFEGALELAEQGLTSGASKRGRAAYEGQVVVSPEADRDFEVVCRIGFDAETSGGLLIAVAPDVAEEAIRRLREAGTPCAIDVGVFEQRAGRDTAVEIV